MNKPASPHPLNFKKSRREIFFDSIVKVKG
jgi:hypothetical protein